MEAGANVTGFRQTRWNYIQTIKPGDHVLCYLSGISMFIGIVEVVSDPYLDTTRIWEEDLFPCRVDVRHLVSLPLELAVPIRQLEQLSIFRTKHWGIYLVASPSKWSPSDGEIVAEAVADAKRRFMN